MSLSNVTGSIFSSSEQNKDSWGFRIQQLTACALGADEDSLDILPVLWPHLAPDLGFKQIQEAIVTRLGTLELKKTCVINDSPPQQ